MAVAEAEREIVEQFGNSEASTRGDLTASAFDHQGGGCERIRSVHGGFSCRGTCHLGNDLGGVGEATGKIPSVEEGLDLADSFRAAAITDTDRLEGTIYPVQRVTRFGAVRCKSDTGRANKKCRSRQYSSSLSSYRT